MDTRTILQAVEHRPFPPPRGPWVMTQIWHTLLFAHWPLAPAALRPLVPPVLPLDTFDGQAWISIVPFAMTYLRPRGFPAIPLLTESLEINVRTYVIHRGIPGVYFFSLDANNPLAVAVARTLVHLPYFPARMHCRPIGDGIHYRTRRVSFGSPSAEFVATYRPAGSAKHAQRGTLDNWLAERYCLYTMTRGERLYRVDIHHGPWPLQPAEAEIVRNTMAVAAGLHLPDTTPLLQYAHRQEVLTWPPALLR
jgi:uncharacterized protein YqjF (DUF2071 family)